MKRFISLFLAFVILFSGCSADGVSIRNETTGSSVPEAETEKNNMRAVWLSYSELSAMSNGKNEREFRDEAVNLAAELLSFGINTVIVHAVPFCDAYYESGILPKSKRLDSRIDYDVFGIICELCSGSGIDVQAWINPYRISASESLNEIKGNKAVYTLYSESRDNLLIYKNGIYLNPSCAEAQKLILAAARELLDKYAVSAIHIDDYFYPDMGTYPDKSSYIKYRKNGGALSVGDWRRENVNALVSSLHTLAHSYGKELAISPAPDIEKNYSQKFADLLLWIDNGWADYIMPQIYFGFENESMPFERVLEDWLGLTDGKKTKLVIGLACYKYAQTDSNAGKGRNEWKENDGIIARQVRLILQKNTIYGVAFFSYSYIFDKKTEKITKKELQKIKSML